MANIIDIIKQPILSEMLLFENAFSNALRTENLLLSNVYDYVLQKRGKQLRPIIVILSAKICGSFNQSTIDSAVSLELLHTASLLHDDVVDDSFERRGKPSVNANWNNKIAILSGDYMFSKSLHSATLTQNLNILNVISNIILNLSDGEILQLENSQNNIFSETDYYRIINKKTAILFSSCSEIGGLSVNAGDVEIKHLRKFGEYLGLCFQMKDDILDYSGNLNIGKPTGNDIREGKITLPLIYVLENSVSPDKDKILKLIENKDYTKESIKLITDFVLKNGGIAYVEKQMDIIKTKAIDELKEFPDNEIKDSLIKCAEYSIFRNT